MLLAGPNARLSDITDHAHAVLSEIAAQAGIPRLTVSSTRRYPYDQARVMYDNCMSDLKRQRKLYAAAGQLVIDVFVSCRRAGLGRNATIAEMQAKIEEIGPYRVSHHAADPKADGRCVFDLDPDSIPEEKRHLFLNAARSDGRVLNLLTPWSEPQDPGVHFEISEPRT